MSPFLVELLIFGILIVGWIVAFGLGAFLLYGRRRSTPHPQPLSHASGEGGEIRDKHHDSETWRSIEWKGLIFRSNSEIKIAKTLDHRGIFFIPATRVRMNAGKGDRQTRELDFVICYEGKWGILEVDGPYHVAQLDSERDRLLRMHGISNIQRFPSERCYQEPKAVVDEFLSRLK